MADPLSKSQTRLRGRKVRDMTDEQLLDWIDACTKMEMFVKPNKARRSWKQGRADAQAEIERRAHREI